MKGNLYTVCFAAILGTVCALLLTGVAKFTEKRYEQNKVAEKNRNVFTALSIDFDKKATAEELVEIFKKNIVSDEKKGKPTLYKYQVDGFTKGVAVEFDGNGRNAKIKGILALENDMETIKGITFYEQEETPGLGADIVLDSFRDRFVGKKIVDSEGKPGILIKAGLVDAGDNEIDGITGATMTIDKVNQMLNNIIEKLTNSK